MYASGRSGWADHELDGPRKDLSALFDLIVNHVPAPRQLAHQSEDFSMLATTLGADPFVGRLLTGRVETGTLRVGATVQALSRTNQKIEQFRVTRIQAFRGLSQQDIEEAQAGDIVSLAGMTKATVADTICALAVDTALPAQPIDPPTITVTFGINDSPLAGRDGKKVQSRVIRDRLMKEAESNVAIKISDTPGGDAFEVAGRGELQMGVLIENMRREGFELSISRPQVLFREGENGERLEPIEVFSLIAVDILLPQPCQHGIDERDHPLPFEHDFGGQQILRFQRIASFHRVEVERQRLATAASFLSVALLPFVDYETLTGGQQKGAEATSLRIGSRQSFLFQQPFKKRLYLILIQLFLKKLRKQSNELIKKNILVKKALEEKELLIKEMHHRVKNNFQLITSLLELETNDIDDQRILKILEKGKNRIKSMALIHQKLYASKSGLIQFDEFINLLVKELTFLYKFDKNIRIDLEVNEMYFDVDTSIPLALILNEIITNSFKYAYKNQKENNLFISLRKASEENYELVIKDNGPGLEENFNIKKADSSGLKLVQRLVKQLQGNLVISNDEGAKFQILFKDTKTRKETI